MTAAEQIAELRKLADQPKPPSLRKALRDPSERNAVHDMTARLQAEIGLRRAAVQMMTNAGISEGLLYG